MASARGSDSVLRLQVRNEINDAFQMIFPVLEEFKKKEKSLLKRKEKAMIVIQIV